MSRVVKNQDVKVKWQSICCMCVRFETYQPDPQQFIEERRFT